MTKRKSTKNAPSPLPEPSDSSDPETQFIELTDDEVNLWDAVEIVAEKGDMFKIRWEGIDPETKKPWADSWVVKTDCTNDLVEAWRVDHPKSASTAKKTRISRSRKSTAAKAKSKSPVKYISRPITIPKHEESDEYDEVPTTKAGPSISKGKSKLPVLSKKRKRTASSYSEEDEDEDDLPPQRQDESISRPGPSKAKKRKIVTTTMVDTERDTESEDDIPKPPKKKPRGRPPVLKSGEKQTGRKTAAVQKERSPSPSASVDEPDSVDAAPAPYDVEKTTTPNSKLKSTSTSDLSRVDLGSGRRNSFASGTLRIDSLKMKAQGQGQDTTGGNGVAKKALSSTIPTAAKSKPSVTGLAKKHVVEKLTPNSNSEYKTRLVDDSRSRQKLKEVQETEAETEDDDDDDSVDEGVQEVVHEKEEGELDDPEEESEVEDGQVVTVTPKETKSGGAPPVAVGTNKPGPIRVGALAQGEDTFVLMSSSPLAKGWSKDDVANDIDNEKGTAKEATVQTVRKTVSRPLPTRASEPQPRPQPLPSPASKSTSKPRKGHSESELNFLTHLERPFSPSTQLKLREFDDLVFPDPVSFGVLVSPPSPYRVLGFLPGVATAATVGGGALPPGAANAGDTAPATVLAPLPALHVSAGVAIPVTVLTDSQNSGETDISIVPETEDPGSSQPPSQEQPEQYQPESISPSPQKQNQNQSTNTLSTTTKVPVRRPSPANHTLPTPITALHNPLRNPSPAFRPTKTIKSSMRPRSRSRSPGKPATNNSTVTGTGMKIDRTGGSGMRLGSGNGGVLNEHVDGGHQNAEVDGYDYEQYIDLSSANPTTATARANGADGGGGNGARKENGYNGSGGKDKDKNMERGKDKEKEKKLGPIPVVPPETFYPHLPASVGHDDDVEDEEEEERIDQWSSPLKRGQPSTTTTQARAQVTRVHAHGASRSRSVETGGFAHPTGEEENEEKDVEGHIEGDLQGGVGIALNMNADGNPAPTPSAPTTLFTHPQTQPNHTQEQSHPQSQYSLPSPSPSLSPPKLTRLHNLLSVHGPPQSPQLQVQPQSQYPVRPQPQPHSQSILPNQSQSLLNPDANANTTSSQSPLNPTSGSGTLYPNISQMIHSSQDSEVLRHRIIARGMEIVEEVRRKKEVELGYGYPRGGVRRRLDEIISSGGVKGVELEGREKEQEKSAAITTTEEYNNDDDVGGEASLDLSMELQYPEEQETEPVAEQAPEAEVETVAVAWSVPTTNVRREGIVSPSPTRELNTLNRNNTDGTRLTKQPELQTIPAQVEAAQALEQEKQAKSLLLEIASLKESLSVANASNESYATRLEDSIAQSQSLHKRVEELLKENVNLRAQAKRQESNATATSSLNTTTTSTDDSHPILAQFQALEAQNTQLSTDLANAQSAKTYLEKDRDFLRAQYATLDTYASQTRLENIDLLKRTEIAEKQVSEGIALIKASFEEKLRVSEQQCKSFSRITEFMIKKDAATDGVRRDAAEAPELRARCLELEAELKGVREEVERLEAEMEVEQLRVEVLEREKERAEEEWERVVGKVKGDLKEAKKEVGKLMVNLNEVKARQHQSGGNGMVFRCEWRPDGDEGPCLYVCETAEELEDHAVHGGHIDIS